MPKSIYKTIRLTPELAEWINDNAEGSKSAFILSILTQVKLAYDEAKTTPRKVIVNYVNLSE